MVRILSYKGLNVTKYGLARSQFMTICLIDNFFQVQL